MSSSGHRDRFTRRDFISTGALWVGSIALAACDREPTGPSPDGPDPRFSHGAGSLHLFMDESGAWGETELFVVGLLATGAQQGERSAVAQIKASHKYFKELKYSSTDRHKASLSRDLFDHLLDDGTDLSFAAAAMRPARRADGVMRWKVYRELLSSVDGNGTPHVTLEQRTVDGFSDLMLAKRIMTFGSGFGVTEVASEGDDLLQLADLLTGCVYGDFMRRRRGRSTPNGRRARNSVKDEIIRELKRRLGVRSLVHRSLAEREGFQVRVLDPSQLR